MEVNKDKGTSVGFTDGISSNFEPSEPFMNTVGTVQIPTASTIKVPSTTTDNKVCTEHEWVEFPSVCCKCGSQKPIRDFKIKENLEVINKNVEDEFVKWLDEIIEFNKQWLYTQSDEEKQMQLLIQIKKKYLEIKKKNT